MIKQTIVLTIILALKAKESYEIENENNNGTSK